MNLKAILPLCISIGFLAETRGQSVEFTGNNVVNAYEVGGKPYVVRKNGIEGSPLISESWGKGWVKFKNGRYIKDVLLKFNLETDELYFNRNEMTLSFVDPVREFVLAYDNNGKAESGIYRNGYPSHSKKDTNSFYQVLADGKKIHFLKDTDKTVADLYTYGGAPQKYYRDTEVYLLFNTETRIIQKINRTKNAIMDALPEFKEAIELFLKDHRYKFRNDDEITELITFLNK